MPFLKVADTNFSKIEQMAKIKKATQIILFASTCAIALYRSYDVLLIKRRNTVELQIAKMINKEMVHSIYF